MIKFLVAMIFGIITLVQTSYAVKVSGIVIDSATQAPVTHAVIKVLSTYQPLGVDTTDEAGAFSVSLNDAGVYTVRASLSGIYKAKSVDINISAEPVEVNFSLSKVIHTTVSGVITDSISATPLGGVRVTVGQPPRSTISADDGTFHIDSVETGEQTFSVFDDAYLSKSLTLVLSSEPFSLTVVLTLVTYVRVSGVVRDSITGTPLADVVVTLKSSPGSNGSFDTTGSDGVYLFNNIQSGSPSVTFRCAGYVSRTTQVAVAGNDPITKSIGLLPVVYGTLQGIVLDSATGAPLSGAIVTLTTGRPEQFDTTGADGVFSFGNVASGTQSLSVSKSDYTSGGLRVLVTAGDTAPVIIAMAPVTNTAVSGIAVKRSSGTTAKSNMYYFRNKVMIPNSACERRVSLFTLDGVCIYRAAVSAGARNVQIPAQVAGRSVTLLVRLDAAGETVVRQIQTLR